MHLKPNRLLFYWRGGAIPQWRRDCSERLISFYPDAERVCDIDENTPETINPEHHSDTWRHYQCILAPRTLWVDNDLMLDEPLELTSQPAMADEFGQKHWSILWSGDSPISLVSKNIAGFNKDTAIGKIKFVGTHYMSRV
jgi:hypothetical protein